MIRLLSRSFSSPNPFKVLGIPESSSKEQIKLAYYRLAKKYHPDINSHYPVRPTQEYFKSITEAYRELEKHDFKYVAKDLDSKDSSREALRRYSRKIQWRISTNAKKKSR